jgi:PhoH-like ATPase
VNNFTGVQVVEGVDATLVQTLFAKGTLLMEEIRSVLGDQTFPNSFAVLKSVGNASALTRVSPDGQTLLLIRDHLQASGVKPRNKEQMMVLSTLLDDRIPVQIISGRAGTGKTLLALACAMQKVEDGVYNKIILTKPMSQVGQYDLGILPGTIEDKFAPFLINYATNVEQLLGGHDLRREEEKKTKKVKADTLTIQRTGLQMVMADFFRSYNVEMVPLQLLRGASFNRAFIIADEIQVLGHPEMLTLGTRVAEGSKLVLMGDLDQRDEKIKRTATGLHKTINDPKMKASSLVSFIELRKVERGPVAELFADVFEPPLEK